MQILTGPYIWRYEEQIAFVLKVLFHSISSTAVICNVAMEIMIEHTKKLGLVDFAVALRKAYVVALLAIWAPCHFMTFNDRCHMT